MITLQSHLQSWIVLSSMMFVYKILRLHFSYFLLLRSPPLSLKTWWKKVHYVLSPLKVQFKTFNMKLQAIPTLQKEATLEGPRFLQRKLLFQNMCGYLVKACLGFVTSEALIQKLIKLYPSYKRKLG
jgi:hypothetical protein